MTGNTWTEVADSAVDQSSPITDVLMTALRDNPKAVAERASGAPIVRIAQPVLLSSGSGNWIVPTGVTAFKVTVVGGGGNGGFADDVQAAGGGGGSGGVAVKWYNNASPGGSYSYSVGTQGVASTFDTVTASPGLDGQNANNGVTIGYGGSSGGSTGGDINGSGQKGENAFSTSRSGAGGSSVFGHGGDQVTGGNVDGINGSGYGSGGSGAVNDNLTANPGGTGAPGVIIIEY